MRKLFLSLLAVCMASLCSGCFELIEELSLNADGSGHVRFTFNASQSKVKLKSIMLMDSVNGHRVPSRSEIDQEIRDAKAALLRVSGISGVKTTVDHESFIYSIEGNFANVRALNQAMNYLAEHTLQKRVQPVKYQRFDNYSFQHGVFRRLEPKQDRAADYHQAKREDREVIDEADYVCIYRFAQTIRKQNNPKARVSPSGKAIMLRAKLRDLILHHTRLSNEITLQ